MYTKNEKLREMIREKGVLIAAHRGTCGGNVVPNTKLSYQNALLHGADLIEADVIMTTDGRFYTFHNGEESYVFGEKFDIRRLSSAEVDKLTMYNCMQLAVNQKPERLEDVLDAFEGRCLINIDRSWFYWKEIIDFLSARPGYGSILLKSAPDPQLLETLEQSGSDIMYMPILRKWEQWETVKKYRVNVAAVELIFETLDSPLVSREMFAELREAGIVPWANSISLDDKTILSAGLDDNHALADGYEENWGRLMDMGFEIVQTDWPALMRDYFGERRVRS